MSLKLSIHQASYIRPVFGTVVLIIGIISMFLPFLPLGYLFILGGVILLAPSVPFLKRFLSYLNKKDKKGRVKKATEKFSEATEKVERKVSVKGDNDRQTYN